MKKATIYWVYVIVVVLIVAIVIAFIFLTYKTEFLIDAIKTINKLLHIGV